MNSNKNVIFVAQEKLETLNLKQNLQCTKKHILASDSILL